MAQKLADTTLVIVVIDLSALYALLDSMKATSLIAVYLVGILYRLQWLMLAPFRVSNAFYLTLICQPLHFVPVFKSCLKDQRKW
jgi:hypothetical protein